MDVLLEPAWKYPLEDWIIWAGAGISVPPRTCLPSGWALTEFSIDAACGQAVRERLMALWSRVGQEVAATSPEVAFPGIPRLESVLGAFAGVEDGAPASLTFLRGFGSFAQAPPNTNHRLLAELVLRGATVVTTNFDLAVQHALADGGAAAVPNCEGRGMLRRYTLEGCPECGEVIHVHGVASDTAQLGATLTMVKRGLPPDFQNYLEARLKRGAVLIFVGYSASDAFDVTPYFVTRATGEWARSTMLFAQHTGYPIPAQARRMGVAFGGYHEAKVDTTAFLHALLRASPGPPEAPAFEWKAAFARAVDGFRQPEAAPVLTCALANELGLNVEALDPGAFGRAEAVNPGYAPANYHSVLALAARGRGEAYKEEAHHRLAGGRPKDLLGYYYARGATVRAWWRALPIREILRMGQIPGPVSWAPYTSMSVHARILLQPYLLMPRLRPTAAVERWRMDRLLRAAEVLGRRPLADVLAVHQVTTALRVRLLIQCIRHGELDVPLAREILSLYSEQSHVGGFVSSYRDFALARLLVMRFTSAAEKLSIAAEARWFAARSHTLARLIGDTGAARRAVLTRRLLAKARPG